MVVVKSHHAAALALAGWYLMVPPNKPNREPDAHAPLSQWTMAGSYDSAKECDERYHSDLDAALDIKRRGGDAQIFERVKAEQCIASDEPRPTGR
jgi:hypothetical protein